MDETNQQQTDYTPPPQDDYAVWEAVIEYEPLKFRAIHQKDFFKEELPEEHRPDYEHIDREHLRLFRMLHPETGRCIIQIPFKEGQGSRLIWRRRRQMVPGMGEVWFYVVGKRGGFCAVIGPDYSVVIDDNFSEDNVLLSDIEPVRGEDGFIAEE